LRHLERQAAAHIDPGWAEAMLLELRLLGVGGARIGAALAEVDSHCAESGQTAEEAFGDPAVYAKSLGLPTEDDVSPKALAWIAAPVLVQVLGMLLLLPSFSAWRAGDLARFSTGMFASVGLLLVLVFATIGRIEFLLRMVLQRPRVAWAAGMAPLTLLVAVQILLRTNALQVPAAWAMALALLLLAAGTVWGLAWHRTHPTAADEVVAPLAQSPYRSWAPSIVPVLTTGLVPLATAAVLALSLWTA